jgi:D-serine deaminase-like pyridoxal phosphate-dependent protein
MTTAEHRVEVIGQPKAEIGTPALLIDAAALDENLRLGSERFSATGVGCRPHAKTHKSPLIAVRQLELGAVGICCAKPSEAEVMLRAGISDVLVTSPVVDQSKVDRLVDAGRHATLSLVVDDPDNINSLAQAAGREGTRLDVLVEVDVGQGRCGVRSSRTAVDLARRVVATKHLRFRGLQGYNGSIQLVRDFRSRATSAREALGRLLDTAQAVRADGISVDVLTGGGTGTSMVDAVPEGFTEIQPGSYVFMDAQYLEIEWEPSDEQPPFRSSLTVLGTVISRPSDELAIVDVGWKAASVDGGPPIISHPSGLTFAFAGDEHGFLRPAEGGTAPRIGTRVELCPSHCDTTVNLYDEYLVIRGGTVEDVWPIEARRMTR